MHPGSSEDHKIALQSNLIQENEVNRFKVITTGVFNGKFINEFAFYFIMSIDKKKK